MTPEAIKGAASNAFGSTFVAASVSTSDASRKILQSADATIPATSETAASALCKPVRSPISPRMKATETIRSDPLWRVVF